MNQGQLITDSNSHVENSIGTPFGLINNILIVNEGLRRVFKCTI